MERKSLFHRQQIGPGTPHGSAGPMEIIMAYMPHSERSPLATVLFAPIEGLSHWFAGWRKAQVSRRTLSELSEMPESRLNDLGLVRQDIYEASKLDPHGVVGLLYERRNVRSRNRSR